MITRRVKDRHLSMIYGLVQKYAPDIEIRRSSLHRHYAVNRHSIHMLGSERAVKGLHGQIKGILEGEGWVRDTSWSDVWLKRNGVLIAYDAVTVAPTGGYTFNLSIH